MTRCLAHALTYCRIFRTIRTATIATKARRTAAKTVMTIIHTLSCASAVCSGPTQSVAAPSSTGKVQELSTDTSSKHSGAGGSANIIMHTQ